jgi:RNA polymerase sigma-70 factor (ECF subfamily)
VRDEKFLVSREAKYVALDLGAARHARCAAAVRECVTRAAEAAPLRAGTPFAPCRAIFRPGVSTLNRNAPLSTAAVVRAHHQSVLRFLRRRGANPDDALDMAQETYVRFLKYEGTTDIDSPAAMLFRIASNVVADYGRAVASRRRFRSFDSGDYGAELASEQPSAERELAAEQILQAVRCVIAALSPPCRTVFLLSRLEGLTYAEIAKQCGISVKTVEKHVSRALHVCGNLALEAPGTGDRPRPRVGT